jgi:acyl-CoA synthetase (AMP-forming)/AMP-acid ligase II/thioesterase domain-containing protein/acyl carrier protein
MNRTSIPTSVPSHTQFSTMYDALRCWAEVTPNRPALVSKDAAPLSYGDLASCVDAMGAALNAFGYGRNDRIGLVHPGGRDMAAAILGIWSYATPVPVNPGATPGELAIQFRDMDIKAVAIAAEMETPARAVAEKFGLPILDVCPDGNGGVALTGISALPAIQNSNTGPADPDDIIAVLATSGTTSRSKIVPLRHRHLLYRNTNAAQALGLTADDRCLNLLRLYHSGGIGQGLATSLISGGSLGVLNDFSVAGIFEAMDAVQPTWCAAPYAIYHAIRPHLETYRETIKRVAPNLRFLRSGTGPLNPAVAADVEKAFRVPIVVTYGSSEAGCMAGDSVGEVRPDRDSVGKPVHEGIGVFDEKGVRVPVGRVGEIATRGPPVFDGYENDDAANRRGFFDDWFRSGDLGYIDGDGYLFITGRIKELINRGGQKVSPTEIDDALLAHPDIADAAAFPMSHSTLGEEIAAAVVMADGATLERSELNQFLSDRLAAHKLPRRLFFVPEIQKGPTGKPQRHMLAEAFGSESSRETANKPSGFRHATLLERQLQKLWAEALGCNWVSLHDDFFTLGGDSLRAVELFLSIERTLGQPLPRSVLFEASTVADMARRIEASTANRCVVPIQPNGRRPPLFCVHDVNGEILNYRALARHLGENQPLYGLQSVGLDAREMPLTSIEDIAARYITEMREVQPVGPYYIGGYSMGGWIAYEMAQQLIDVGELVALLALFDTHAGQGRRYVMPMQWVRNHHERIASLAAREIPRYLAKRIRNAGVLATTALRERLFAGAWQLYAARKREMPKFLLRPTEANLMARRTYTPKPYAGNVVLFKAAPYALMHSGIYDGWGDLVQGELAVRDIAGQHSEILEEPYVRTLAAALADCLAERRRTA